MQSISLEVITTFCFAKRFDAIEYPGYQYPFLAVFLESIRGVILVQHFPFLRLLVSRLPEWLMVTFAPQSLAFAVFTRMLAHQIDDILEDPTLLEKADQETIYQHLLNPKSGPKLTRDTLQREANTMVAAGTNTVANIGNMAVFQVLHSEAILRRLRQELKDAFPDVGSHMPLEKLEKLEKLPYLVRLLVPPKVSFLEHHR